MPPIEILELTRDVSIAECAWLTRTFAKGELVHRYVGYTYGCITPDGVAVTEPHQPNNFFELPKNALKKYE